jgi:death-on-curing protein
VKLENVAFVTVEVVENIHDDEVIRVSGGKPGVLNKGLLLSAVEAPKATFDGNPLYASLAEMAAVYAWSIARNHAFIDGNKRTALLVAWTFLAMNGQRIALDASWVDLMERAASAPAFDRAELVRAFAANMSVNETVE